MTLLRKVWELLIGPPKNPNATDAWDTRPAQTEAAPAQPPRHTHPCRLCGRTAVRFGACEDHLVLPEPDDDGSATCARCGESKPLAKFGQRKIGVHATGGWWMWGPTVKCDDCRRPKAEREPALRDTADYETSSKALDLRIYSKGKHHNLTPIFRRVSAHHGDAAKGWTITWGRFGCKNVQRRQSIRLGCCYAAHKTIVVHPLLDDPRVPEWYIEWLLHHEVLHIVHPPIVGGGSKWQIHHPVFRRAERQTPRYQDAQRWEATDGRKLWYAAPKEREAGKRAAARSK